MAKISYSSQALADLERISDFLSDEGPSAQLEVSSSFRKEKLAISPCTVMKQITMPF